MGSAWRHFLHSLIAASITFCSRPIQTSPVASWIHQYSWMLGLFNRRAAEQQSNLVIDWLLVATYPERWNCIKFLLILMHILFVLFLPGSAKADVGWGGKLNGHFTSWPFDGQLCHEYVCQKLLKLDNPSSSYGKKIGCVFYASQCISTATETKHCYDKHTRDVHRLNNYVANCNTRSLNKLLNNHKNGTKWCC